MGSSCRRAPTAKGTTGLRIIAGEFRGRRLVTPPGRALRPTADRIREAWFNILGSRVRGAACLDLFAGTGALALEALSRGAARATLVENDPAALAVIFENVRRLGVGDRVTILRADAGGDLGFLKPAFDLILADPPYGRGLAGGVVGRVARRGLLGAGGVMVVEHGRSETLPLEVAGLRLSEVRSYGSTGLSFFVLAIVSGKEDTHG